MPKYAKPIVTESRKKRGRPLKYSRDRYAEVLRLRLKGSGLGTIAKETMIPKSTVYRMLRRLGFS
jgi:hypothetical protein